MQQVPVIQVGLPPGGFFEQIRMGIADYRDNFADWLLFLSLKGNQPNFAERLHGGIVSIQNPQIQSVWKNTGVPVVNISNSMEEPVFPSILVDDFRVGELAGEHFAERNFENFAYLGSEVLFHSINRERGFRSKIQSIAKFYSVYQAENNLKFHYKLFGPQLLSWIKSLPLPCAIFCNDDNIGSSLINFLILSGIEVPTQIAVLGVNNDETLCAFSRRPLSSVIINGRSIGMQAGNLLHHLLRGEEVMDGRNLVKPTGVALRLSTDITAQENPMVARALQFIRNSLSDSISALDIAEHVGASRRVLERQFSHHLGHGPYEEIMRQRLNRAKQLLLDNDWPIYKIATACGFREHSLFTMTFHKREGMSPFDFRNSLKVNKRSIDE